ncbi:MAG: TetR/AcrR family transcriptional regulator [Deltaproteobacteria bacterium]|nr:MAG: TetR/AcrR family transcriptional regulator [Deltaproteobacteria bacterium]
MKSASVTESDVSPRLGRAPDRSRAATRRRLKGAGTALFARRGLHGTTTAQIAHRAGVASGTFYLHFRDKHALFREIVFEALDALRDRLADASARAAADPVARVRERATELLAFADENRNLVRVLFGREHEAGELAEAVIDELVSGIEERLRGRIAAGAVPSGLHPAVAAQALAAMWARVVAWWLEDPRRAPREAVIETLVQIHPVYRAAVRR